MKKSSRSPHTGSNKSSPHATTEQTPATEHQIFSPWRSRVSPSKILGLHSVLWTWTSQATHTSSRQKNQRRTLRAVYLYDVPMIPVMMDLLIMACESGSLSLASSLHQYGSVLPSWFNIVVAPFGAARTIGHSCDWINLLPIQVRTDGAIRPIRDGAVGRFFRDGAVRERRL